MKRILLILLILITIVVGQDNSILNIKHLKFVKKVLTVPSGYDKIREHGNIFEHNGQFIFTSTAVKSGIYSIHYWTASNKSNWSYKGKLNLGGIEGEDPYLDYYDNKFRLLIENKTAEKKYTQWKIAYLASKTLNGQFLFYGSKYGYAPEDTGINGIEAVYSPLLVDKNTLISDWRTMKVKPHEENIGLTKWNGYKWGALKTIMLAKDYGYSSLGVGGSLYKEAGMNILELAGLVDYGKPTQGFVNGLAGCSKLTGDWKLLNKILVNEKGERIWATFFKDGGKWYALAALRNSNDIYLAKIIS